MSEKRKTKSNEDEGALSPKVRADIAAGERDLRAGRVFTTEELMRQLGIDQNALRRNSRKK